MVRHKAVIGHRHIDPYRRGRKPAAGECNDDERAAFDGIDVHEWFQFRSIQASMRGSRPDTMPVASVLLNFTEPRMQRKIRDRRTVSARLASQCFGGADGK